ncbi:hypothetical protein H6P81_006245 [Aristolochia fimbriata]|uniref:Uncharacterized protein n=1 Tax=Aristolochia fimbriata TaxID=158543 RepID=A0AAV7EZK7_ARIFI|nr:hypothetical protein H6P81_006245 [Aristolochia fimbriata]
MVLVIACDCEAIEMPPQQRAQSIISTLATLILEGKAQDWSPTRPNKGLKQTRWRYELRRIALELLKICCTDSSSGSWFGRRWEVCDSEMKRRRHFATEDLRDESRLWRRAPKRRGVLSHGDGSDPKKLRREEESGVSR